MIACLLDRTKDRLAIVGPSSRLSSNQSQCNVLVPLQSIDLTDITNVLTSVEKSLHGITPPEISMEEAMKVSVDLLSRPPTNWTGQSPRECPRRVLRHIFLLAPIVYKVPNNIPNGIQVHIINPSTIPSKAGLWINNGWQLHLPPSTMGNEKSINEEDDYASGCIRKILANARTGKLPGWLSNVSIDISAGSNCEIETILGDTRYHSLAPGQTASMFIKVKTSPLRLSPPLHVDTINQGEHHPSSDYLDAQLAVLLGETAEDILQVKVQYKHTLLPVDTVMSVEKLGVIRRRIGQSAWGSHTMEMDHNQGHNRTLVYKRLGSFTAANWPPLQALVKLQELCGGDRYLQLKAIYLRPLIKELRQRARIMEIHGLLHDDRPWKGDTSKPATDVVIRPLFYGRDRAAKKEDPIPPVPPSEKPTSNANSDEARKIWREMRRGSKTQATKRSHRRGWSDRSLFVAEKLPRSSTSTEEYDDFIWEITDQAIRNKRSLGTDTLRSIAFDGRVDSAGGCIAPWL